MGVTGVVGVVVVVALGVGVVDDESAWAAVAGVVSGGAAVDDVCAFGRQRSKKIFD